MNKEGVTFINCLHTRKPTNSADGKEKKLRNMTPWEREVMCKVRRTTLF